MNFISGRVLFAGFLSLGVFGASHYLAQRFRPPPQKMNTQKPLAQAEQLNDAVEKRSVSSLIWKDLSEGEALHAGEAVKTSENGEVRIQFENSSKFIDLEPDSQIILQQESGSEISLDLVQGSFVVAQKSESPANEKEPTLVLKSKEGSLDLSQATAHLQKSQDSSVNIQVM
ncbi:MAG: hypothetical protein ACAH59_08865, partial [Pseudobdellovibrionaceae bacterium]